MRHYTSVDREFTVASKAGQSIQFEALPNVPVTTTSVTLQATASSGLPVTFTLVAGNATLSGATLAIKGSGQITIRASQSGNDRFDAAPAVERSFEVIRLAQTISLAEIPSLHFGDAAEQLTAIASSGLPVALQLLSGPAEVTGDLLKPISSGSVTIRASQSGNDTWSPAPDVERTLIIARALQTITFPLPVDRLVPDGRIRLTATASSDLPVTFRVVSGPGELSDDVLYANGLGEIIVEASQMGDTNYEAVSLQQTMSVLGSPELSVGLSNGKLILTWPDNHGAFQLESATTLDGPWSSFTLPDPSQNQAEITTDTDSRFFRLKSN